MNGAADPAGPEAPFSRLSCDADEEDLSTLETIPDPHLLPEEVAERVELARSLWEAIATLPPRLRPVVQLRCFGELTFAERALSRRLPRDWRPSGRRADSHGARPRLVSLDRRETYPLLCWEMPLRTCSSRPRHWWDRHKSSA